MGPEPSGEDNEGEMTVTERVAAFRSRHLINVIEERDPYIGRIYRCALDGLRVQPMRDGRWRHDSAAVIDLLDQEYGGSWGRARAIERIAEEEFDRNPEGDPTLNGAFR